MDKEERNRKGGNALVTKYGKAYMSKIGKEGAKAFWKKYKLVPFNVVLFAIVDKETGEVVGIKQG